MIFNPFGTAFLRVGVLLLQQRRDHGLYQQALRRAKLHGREAELATLTRQQIIEQEKDWNYQQLCRQSPLVPKAVEGLQIAGVFLYLLLPIAVVLFLYYTFTFPE